MPLPDQMIVITVVITMIIYDDLIVVHLHCENEDIVGFKEAKVSEKTKPHQKVPSACWDEFQC